VIPTALGRYKVSDFVDVGSFRMLAVIKIENYAFTKSLS